MNATLSPELTAADRCDRCGAQAYVRARLADGLELHFCAHHGREHIPALKDLAEIDDDSARLDESTPAVLQRIAALLDLDLPGGTVLVSHGDTIGLAVGLLSGRPPTLPANASITEVVSLM